MRQVGAFRPTWLEVPILTSTGEICIAGILFGGVGGIRILRWQERAVRLGRIGRQE